MSSLFVYLPNVRARRCNGAGAILKRAPTNKYDLKGVKFEVFEAALSWFWFVTSWNCGDGSFSRRVFVSYPVANIAYTAVDRRDSTAYRRSICISDIPTLQRQFAVVDWIDNSKKINPT